VAGADDSGKSCEVLAVSCWTCTLLMLTGHLYHQPPASHVCTGSHRHSALALESLFLQRVEQFIRSRLTSALSHGRSASEGGAISDPLWQQSDLCRRDSESVVLQSDFCPDAGRCRRVFAVCSNPLLQCQLSEPPRRFACISARAYKHY
jgi:hypothetical protein